MQLVIVNCLTWISEGRYADLRCAQGCTGPIDYPPATPEAALQAVFGQGHTDTAARGCKLALLLYLCCDADLQPDLASLRCLVIAALHVKHQADVVLCSGACTVMSLCRAPASVCGTAGGHLGMCTAALLSACLWGMRPSGRRPGSRMRRWAALTRAVPCQRQSLCCRVRTALPLLQSLAEAVFVSNWSHAASLVPCLSWRYAVSTCCSGTCCTGKNTSAWQPCMSAVAHDIISRQLQLLIGWVVLPAGAPQEADFSFGETLQQVGQHHAALTLLQAGAGGSSLTSSQACTALQVHLATAPCTQAYVQVRPALLLWRHAWPIMPPDPWQCA